MDIEFIDTKTKNILPAPQLRWALLLAGLLFSIRLAFSYLIHNQELLSTFSNFYLPIEGLAAVGSSIYASCYIAKTNRQFLKAWIFLTLGMVSLLIGNLIWAALSIFYMEFPTPSLADLFFVLFYVFIWLGLYYYPLSLTRGSDHKYVWLDNIIVMLGSGLFFWVFLFDPLVDTKLVDFSHLPLAMLYPILDMMLLWSLLSFFRKRPEQSTYLPILLIGLSQVVVLTADSLFAYQTITGNYTYGNITDVIWSIGSMICILASFSQVRAISLQAKNPKQNDAIQSTDQSWPVYLPYFWLIIANVIIIAKGITPLQQPEDFIITGLIIILVVLRQVLTLHDNQQLFVKAQIELNERKRAQQALRLAQIGLEARVIERTADLQEANEELQAQIADRISAEQALRHRAEIDQLIATISSRIMVSPKSNLEEKIFQTLAILCKFVEAERCYLAQYNSDGSAFSITHEWHVDGKQPDLQNMQNIPITPVSWWIQKLNRFEIIQILDVAQMPAEVAADAAIQKAAQQQDGVDSMTAVPLISEYRVIGFLGLYTKEGKHDFMINEGVLLRAIAEILTNALSRAKLQLDLQVHIQQVEKSLEEKNVLLKEIHHRVKNNLQVISSLLSLQSAQIKDAQTEQLFRESQNRVRTMALIHEKLYQSQDLARINFRGYVQSLISFLVRSFAAGSQEIEFRIEIDDTRLGIDQSIPCGLIINELVSNCFKYAFPEDRSGEVVINFHSDEARQYYLNVGDNGIGFPENIDFQNTTSLGLQLVNSLVDQLDGKIELIRDAGTEFRIAFCEPEVE